MKIKKEVQDDVEGVGETERYQREDTYEERNDYDDGSGGRKNGGSNIHVYDERLLSDDDESDDDRMDLG